jgi:hypothetical protein
MTARLSLTKAQIARAIRAAKGEGRRGDGGEDEC